MFYKKTLLPILAVGFLLPTTAMASPFKDFFGRWQGGGKVRLGGNPEGARCVSTFISTGQKAIQINVRCSTTSFKVDIRCNVTTRNRNLSGECRIRSHSNAVYRLQAQLKKKTITGYATSSGVKVTVRVKSGGSGRLSINASSGKKWGIKGVLVRG